MQLPAIRTIKTSSHRSHTHSHALVGHPHPPALIGHERAALALALGRTQNHQLQDVAHCTEDGPQVSLGGLKGHLAHKQLPAIACVYVLLCMQARALVTASNGFADTEEVGEP